MPKRPPKPPAVQALPPDLEELLVEGGFRDPAAARSRVDDLYGDNAELLALARLSGPLKDALAGCADPDAALLHLGRLVAVRGSRLQLYRTLLDHPALLYRFVLIVAASRYLADILVRNPEYLSILGDFGVLSRTREAETVREELRNIASVHLSEAAKLHALRRFHRRETLRIAAAEILGFQNLAALTRQVSNLADAFVSECLEVLSGGSSRHGLVVLALGKWGGRELNYSSDVDVIFLTPQSGDLERTIGLAKRLIRALTESTYEGVVYRVDVRLRPYGSEGPLVSTIKMFEDYLRRKAAPAERQAMLKARIVAGKTGAQGRRILDRLAPILLKDAADARTQIRALKSRIEKHLEKQGQVVGHVKSAPGGIRDVEFIVQALQLEHGRARPDVLGGNTLEALEKLEAAELLARDDARALRDGYVFLRAVEHRMQLMGNKQIYHLPTKEDELARLGKTMGFTGTDSGNRLMDAVDTRTRKVRSLFDRMLGAGRTETDATPSPTFETIRGQLGSAADRLDLRVVRRAADLIDELRAPEDVRVYAQQNDDRRWTVAVCAADLPGLLSIVSGLFVSRWVQILSGDFLRLRFPQTTRRRPRSSGRKTRPSTTRKILDVFEVSLPEPVSPDFWESYRDQLAEMVALVTGGREEAAQEQVLTQAGAALSTSDASAAPLYPVRIEIRNDTSDRETELHIHSSDTLGFVYEFATTLAALRIDVERAVVRTLGNDVYDTFWVTDLHGRKIVDPRALDEVRVAAVLVKQFTHLLPRSPNPALALRQFTALLHQILSRPEWIPELRNLESPAVLNTFAKLMGVSRFLWEDFLLLQHENLFPVVVNVPSLERGKTRAEREQELDRALAGARDEETIASRVNEFKDREMFRIDLRHITRRSGFREFTSALSDLAEVVVDRTSTACDLELRKRHGPPRTGRKKTSPWCIAALGKFGGRELGIASDLDLIFVYEGEGKTGGKKSIATSDFYDEFVRTLHRLLKARREVSFGIDTRLRPYGSGGAPATSLQGFQEYYSEKGPAKQFERMALVKLAPVAGDAKFGTRLLKERDAFVYSGRPLDYENILHLRARQASELVPAGETNAKYSPGGLADVEYFVQARQIEAGHRDPSVRVPNTLDAIERLVRGGHLRTRLLTELSGTYVFLRRLIDALRVVRGLAKDSVVPAGSLPEFAYLVRRLEYDSPAQLEGEIRQRMSFARNLWSEVKFPSA